MTKEKFINIINQLQESNRIVSEVNKVFRESTLNTDFCNAAGMAIYHEGLVVELLDILFDSDGTIEWWVYEADYGKKFTAGSFRVNGVPVDLSTAEKLYDYVEGCKNEN